MYTRGVHATTLDDVREASGTSKSQLYQHFANKDQLIQDVVHSHTASILSREEVILSRVSSFSGLKRWTVALVKSKDMTNGSYGCVIGSMANELADENEIARQSINDAFEKWANLIEGGLRRIQESGQFRDDVDIQRLSIGMLSALQGGYVLARAAHDVKPMRIALDMALDYVSSYLRTSA